MINDMINTQLNHRTIREFKDKEVPEDVFKTLIDVAQRTPTSNGMQQSSVIRVTDSRIKEEFAQICKQEYVKRTPILLIFIVDTYRNHQIALEKGLDSENSGDMDRFFQGFTDGALAAQNIVNAAESLGLGAVYFGSILNDPGRVIELLNLPKYTFPVVGLGLGYPNQEPQLKPRMDMEMRLFENTYEKKDNYLEEIKEYDQVMRTYYDLRQAHKPMDKFSLQVADKLKNTNPRRQLLVNDIVNQGFDLKLEK